MTRRRPFMAMALLALAAACAAPTTTDWRKPGAGVEDWDRDAGTCRARARALADRELRTRSAETGAPLTGPVRTFEGQMAIHDARRRERQLFEDCLRAKGYAPEKGAEK